MQRFAYISWKKEYSLDLKTSPEEAIVISSEKMKLNYVRECLKVLFFIKWYLATSPSTRGQEFPHSEKGIHKPLQFCVAMQKQSPRCIL